MVNIKDVLYSEDSEIKLRFLDYKDLESIVNNISKEVVRWLPKIPWPYRYEDALNYIVKSLQGYITKSELNYGIVIDYYDDIVIGTISLYNIDFINKRAELGYLLNKNYWGRHIMSRSVKTIIDYAFYDLNLIKVYGGVLKGNSRSYNLLKKFGFREDGFLRCHYLKDNECLDEIIMSLLNSEYESKYKK